MESSYIHVHAIRGASGDEILIARVLAPGGKIGLGFSLRLDATEARHMAEWQAGVQQERPRYQPALDHPWEKAWISESPIEWHLEPAFVRISWLSGAPEGAAASVAPSKSSACDTVPQQSAEG